MARLGFGEKLCLLLLAGLLVFLAPVSSTLKVSSLATSFGLCAWYIWNQFTVWRRLGVSGPTPWPFIGSLTQIYRKGGMHAFDTDCVQKYGRVFGDYVMDNPNLVVADADLLKQVLVKDFDNFPNRRTFSTKEQEKDPIGIFDQALSVLTDENWKRVRSTVSPAFTSGKMKLVMPQFTECAGTLKSILDEKCANDETFDAVDLFGCFTMDVICSVAFCTKVDSQRNPDNPVVRYAKEAFNFRLTDVRFMFLISFPWTALKVMKYTGMRVIFSQGEEFFRKTLGSMIESRRQNPKFPPDFLQIILDAHNENVHNNEEDTHDFLLEDSKNSADLDNKGVLRNVQKGMTDSEIIAQCLIFLLAGYHTTATSLAFLAYSFARNPEAQQKCYTEIMDAVGKDGELSYEVLQHKLPYLEGAVMENLRLYPPATRFDRIAKKDYNLNGITVPAGAGVAAPVYVIHHSEEYYPDPESFKPERFLPAERAQRNPLTFLPFGFGPRNCIAMRFALLELKLAMAHIVRDFEIKLASPEQMDKPVELDSVSLLKPKTPLTLKVSRRS